MVVTGLDELETVRLEGKGTSGAVSKVIHKPTGTVLALKVCVDAPWAKPCRDMAWASPGHGAMCIPPILVPAALHHPQVISLDVTEKALDSNLLELRTLYESTSPYIVSFYGAFYAEGMHVCMHVWRMHSQHCTPHHHTHPSMAWHGCVGPWGGGRGCGLCHRHGDVSTIVFFFIFFTAPSFLLPT